MSFSPAKQYLQLLSFLTLPRRRTFVWWNIILKVKENNNSSRSDNTNSNSSDMSRTNDLVVVIGWEKNNVCRCIVMIIHLSAINYIGGLKT